MQADRFERFAASLSANNKLRDASRVNSLRCANKGSAVHSLTEDQGLSWLLLQGG